MSCVHGEQGFEWLLWLLEGRSGVDGVHGWVCSGRRADPGFALGLVSGCAGFMGVGPGLVLLDHRLEPGEPRYLVNSRMHLLLGLQRASFLVQMSFTFLDDAMIDSLKKVKLLLVMSALSCLWGSKRQDAADRQL